MPPENESQACLVPIKVTVAETVQLSDASELAEMVRRDIGEHLARKNYGPADCSQLQIEVESLEILRNGVRTKFRLTGFIGGKHVDRQFVRTLLCGLPPATASANVAFAIGAAATAFLGAVITHANLAGCMFFALMGGTICRQIVSVLSRSVDDSAAKAKLRDCVRECIGEICTHIDYLLVEQAPARGEPDAAATWSRICLLRWCLSVPVSVVGAINGLRLRNENDPMVVIIVIALMQGLSVFGSVHLFGLAAMPSRFFRNDPRGQKALARFGVKSIVGMRVVAAFFGLGLVTVAVCAGLPLFGFIK